MTTVSHHTAENAPRSAARGTSGTSHHPDLSDRSQVDPDALEWWTAHFLRLTTDTQLADRCARVHAENETLKRRAAGIPTPPQPSTDQRENLLRSLAQAVRSDDLTRARTLAHQENHK